MSVLWQAAEAAAATGGQTVGNWAATGVSIDTRSLQPGDLFVALKDQRDGHEFVAQALEKGAAAALVSHRPEGVAADAPLLLVPEVLPALEALGQAARARLDPKARVIAITGSVGKTSTKEMLRAALTGQGRIHAAEKSYNNHWGVPLTLARMPADTEFAVIEIGMSHPREIAPLARMARPHVAMITTIAAAHLEAFDNIDGIAREKAAIFDGLEPGGVAVINGDLPTTPILTAAAERRAASIRLFGEGRASFDRLLSATVTGDVTVGVGRCWRTRILFKLNVPGRHFAMNAMGVLGAVRAVGGDLALAAAALGQWEPPEGRGRRIRLLLDPVDDRLSVDLLDDAFNANPTSMAAALEVLAATEPVDGIGRIGTGRRVAILGDMLELGPDGPAQHAGLAGLPAMKTVDIVHCVGPLMQGLWQALPKAQRGQWTENATELAAGAHRLIDAGDVVLVKGSKGIAVSRVVDALKKLGHPLPSDTRGTT